MYLGIDTGTGGTRALLIDERGAVRAGCTARSRGHDDGAPAVGRAASGELVGRRCGRHSRRARAGRRNRARCARHRAIRPDARAGASRRRRRGHPAIPDLVRSAQPAAGRRRQREGGPRERAPATSRIRCSRASRCRNCCGYAITSRGTSSGHARCFCRKIMCASN